MKLSSIIVPSSNKLKRLKFAYSGNRTYTFQLADIITQMTVISSQPQNMFNRSALTNVTIGSNVSAIGISCFVDCENLTDVTTYDKLKVIDDYAFKDCTNLRHVSFLDKSNKNAVYAIGESAFANTGLEDVTITLSGTSTNTYIMPYAFANCTKLKSMTNVRSNYLANYEFANCTSLTSINLPNSHSFMGEGVFQNCISLRSVVIPAKTFGIGERMFDGCINLTSIVFDDSPQNPSQLTFIKSFRNHMLNGTAITSLVFPASITSWTCFDDYALQGMSQLQQITFNGMDINQICEISQTTICQYDMHYVYTSKSQQYLMYGVFNSRITSQYDASYKIEDYFKKTSTSDINTIISYCKQQGIPLINFICGDPTECGNCEKFMTYVMGSKNFLNWLKNENNKCIIVLGDDQDRMNYSQLTNGNNAYVIMVAYWKKPDGQYFVKGYSTLPHRNIESGAALVNFINSSFAEFNGANKIEYTINADIYNSHMFGLNHNVKLIARDLTSSVDYIDDGQGSTPQIIYDQTTQVDKITVDDFRLGQWYKNAEQLKAYADLHHLPVLIEFGSKSCPPCEDFTVDVFNSSEFQSLVAQKRILLCRVISEDSFSKGSEYFVSNVWAPIPERPEGKMPILLFYWNNINGAIIISGQDSTSAYEIVTKIYAHYNNANDVDYPYCRLLYDKQSTLNWLNNECFSILPPDYSPDARFNLPSIYVEMSYPRYKKYQLFDNDSYGRYFPVNDLQPAQSGINYHVNVKNDSGMRTDYVLRMDSQSQLPPPGTYQCFTLPRSASDSDEWYNANYDISGVIFKVGSETSYEQQPYATDNYSYESKLQSDYLAENSVTGANIISYVSSFYSDAYKEDENGNPTTQFDDNAFAPGESYYNMTWTYYVSNVQHAEQSASKIVIYSRAGVELVTDDDYDKYLVVTGQPYVIKAEWYRISDLGTRLLWLSCFNNYSG